MKDTTKRILTSAGMLAIGGGAVVAEYFGFGAIRWLAVFVAGLMTLEVLMIKKWNWIKLAFLALVVLFGFSGWFVGAQPWIMFLMLIIIAAADTGAWFFGRLLGGDKMWERLSPNKTWSGQIAGIICGTVAAIMYGLLGADVFMPQLMWIGIGVSLMSQYGDLTASWVKRKLGLKDFGKLLPGHGGLLDRFDGWLYVLPIIWLVML